MSVLRQCMKFSFYLEFLCKIQYVHILYLFVCWFVHCFTSLKLCIVSQVFLNIICNIYSPTKVKHHLTCFNNIFYNNELISNRFAVFVTYIHILTYLWNRLLIDFYLCVYDRVCKVPRVFFNICVCERKLICFCVEF